MPQNHFREPKNRREHLLSSLPIVLPVAAVTISAAAFGLLFLQGDLVEDVYKRQVLLCKDAGHVDVRQRDQELCGTPAL